VCVSLLPETKGTALGTAPAAERVPADL
jgi:hypothetical protein